MKVVIQEEATGCAIACSAAIAGLSYKEAKQTANSLGIFAVDSLLWSNTKSIRNLLVALGFHTGKKIDFTNWDSLADCSLLASKWHLEDGKPYWHWVVFMREEKRSYVLDSNASLAENLIIDLERVDAKWFIPVKKMNIIITK
ncbi:MAG TPA: hypothetical protein EYG68_06310 [Leucothrix mucor]|nr:hypothetical protein [Leucothrix mucor]